MALMLPPPPLPYYGIVKRTQFGQKWVLFFPKWYTDGWEIRQKIGIEKVRFSRSSRHIHVRCWLKVIPPELISLKQLHISSGSFILGCFIWMGKYITKLYRLQIE